MDIEIKIDISQKETKVIIISDEMNEEIHELVERISANPQQMIIGFQQEKATILNQEDIFRIYSEQGKVYAQLSKEVYVLRMRLYELEACLNSKEFVRISNSEIINLKKVKNFDLSFSGVICVKLTDGTITYVSRRYVSKIKKILGI